MGGKSGGGKAKVTEYKMSTHYGICHGGENVSLRALYFGEKLAWEGNLTAPGVASVNAPDLFGGPQKEGGVAGDVYWLPGRDDQLMPEELAGKFGVTQANCPGFRGIASVFMTGVAAAGGFLWSHNSPYLKTCWMKLTSQPLDIGLLNANAMIGDDANPAHIIFDCLTDDDCMGAPVGMMDVQSFKDCAATLYSEGFGLSMGWFAEATIESYISEVLDHIQGTVFVNPLTGLFTMKLLRNDYVFADLPVFDESNCKVVDYQRKVWGETVNQISVTYTNPENEEKIAITYQELGNVIAQGATVGDSRDYYGVRNGALAAKLAVRDCRASSAPLASCTILADRSAWRLVPGSVLRLSNTKNNIVDQVMRIGTIDYGTTSDPTIKISVIEDIFSLRVQGVETPPSSLWNDGRETPSPRLDFLGFTLPSFFIKLFANKMPVEPEVAVGMVATQNGSDTFTYDLQTEVTTIGGGLTYQSLGTRSLNKRATLTEDLPAELTSAMSFSSSLLGVGPQIEAFVYFQGTDEEDCEIGFITDRDSNGDWIVSRGMLDTVPRAWPTGTHVWFIVEDSPVGDQTSRVPGETVNYKLLMKTSKGVLLLADAPVDTVTTSARSHLPLRPANVKVNGQGFGEYDARDDSNSAASLVVTWANRNRLNEEVAVFYWDGATMTPEVGQTTTIKILAADQTTVLATHDGISGTTYTLDPGDFGGEALIYVQATSKLDGLESLQGFMLPVRLQTGGWGFDWDFNWGT